MMDKTININLAGTLFQVDEEAYRVLRDYLQAINNRFRNVQGGAETVEDIESRIAEIFQSQRGLAGVITKDNVDAMISIIGKPEDFDQGEAEVEAPVYTSRRKRMYRNPDNAFISGVCGGIGAYLNADPVIFRILFVLFALFFGSGFLLYIILWIALPTANNDAKKREMYGDAFQSVHFRENNTPGSFPTNEPIYNSGYYNSSGIGNAFNEIFGAVGKVFFIIFRVFLIITGVILMLTGFLFILSFVMIFVFKYPGAFSTDAFDFNLIYFPDFLNYIVNPSVAPWIIALATTAFILPMLALIYWGVKMIFWFRAKDGILSLVALVVWVMSVAALSLILFNEGISFAESGKKTSQAVLPVVPKTLYIKANKKVADLKFDREIAIKQEGYTVFIDEEKPEIYIRPYLNINPAIGESTLKITKRSSGRTEMDAGNRSEELLYSYRIIGDTLFLDEYFTIPSGRKWSADNVGVNLYIPEGTTVIFDPATEKLLHKYRVDSDEDDSEGYASDSRRWIMTEDGLNIAEKTSSGIK